MAFALICNGNVLGITWRTPFPTPMPDTVRTVDGDGNRAPLGLVHRATLEHMRLIAEFTTEPFHGEGEPPPHARHAVDVVRASGLEYDFGPLGTSVGGDPVAVLSTLSGALAAAFEYGATRVTMQIERTDG